ncbi:MAG: hypothetical protein ACOC93_06650, partial [Planctomycetota bacterium]
MHICRFLPFAVAVFCALAPASSGQERLPEITYTYQTDLPQIDIQKPDTGRILDQVPADLPSIQNRFGDQRALVFEGWGLPSIGADRSLTFVFDTGVEQQPGGRGVGAINIGLYDGSLPPIQTHAVAVDGFSSGRFVDPHEPGYAVQVTPFGPGSQDAEPLIAVSPFDGCPQQPCSRVPLPVDLGRVGVHMFADGLLYLATNLPETPGDRTTDAELRVYGGLDQPVDTLHDAQLLGQAILHSAPVYDMQIDIHATGELPGLPDRDGFLPLRAWQPPAVVGFRFQQRQVSGLPVFDQEIVAWDLGSEDGEPPTVLADLGRRRLVGNVAAAAGPEGAPVAAYIDSPGFGDDFRGLVDPVLTLTDGTTDISVPVRGEVEDYQIADAFVRLAYDSEADALRVLLLTFGDTDPTNGQIPDNEVVVEEFELLLSEESPALTKLGQRDILSEGESLLDLPVVQIALADGSPMNARGDVALGVRLQGDSTFRRAYVSPIPEPLSLSLLALGIPGEALTAMMLS